MRRRQPVGLECHTEPAKARAFLVPSRTRRISRPAHLKMRGSGPLFSPGETLALLLPVHEEGFAITLHLLPPGSLRDPAGAYSNEGRIQQMEPNTCRVPWGKHKRRKKRMAVLGCTQLSYMLFLFPFFFYKATCAIRSCAILVKYVFAQAATATGEKKKKKGMTSFRPF